MFYPLIKEIEFQDPLPIFSKFAHQQGSLFLNSAQLMKDCGRYSFIALDPFLTLTSKNGKINLNNEQLCSDPFQVLSEQLERFPMNFHSELPPFQGGVAGFFGYDLYQHLEKISASQQDDMQFPDLALGFYDLVIAFDHEVQRAWIFSSGYPLKSTNERENRAKKRCEWLLNELKTIPTLSKTFLTCNETDIQANFSKNEYQSAVIKVKDFILDGDIFEANISQRFMVKLSQTVDAFNLYRRLHEINPAPFSAYLVFGDTILVSASPERFLKLTGEHIETRPIKGTRRRGKSQEEDSQIANELIASEKDQAENVMIVDLLRNDLSRVCNDHSVKVPKLCGLESYATVHHLVSVVTGRLQAHYNAVDLLRVAFPGGSITGAPKIRAMEIIAEIEPTKRGPYCGSIGYIGFNGDMDTSIIIRTYAIKDNIVTFQAGGAIVLDSDPLLEYEETLTKAKALRSALIE